MVYGLASKHFGITNLFPFQLEAISTAVSGCDSLVIQPTGKGKSLCYQLVALQQRKLVFVFVPTLALMYDQVLHLNAKGIPAVALGRMVIALIALVSTQEHALCTLQPSTFMVPLVSAVGDLNCYSNWQMKDELGLLPLMRHTFSSNGITSGTQLHVWIDIS